MSKVLVAFFSASGVTKKMAANLADTIGADLFEIVPEKPYSKLDLMWMNPKSRSSVEMKDRSCRPAIASRVDDMAQYDVVFVGFPVWWYREPSIIDTFAESLTLKKISMIIWMNRLIYMHGLIPVKPDIVVKLIEGAE